ncbi:MAG: cycloartenol synthase [Thermodesulfobacteriota bacterium]
MESTRILLAVAAALLVGLAPLSGQAAEEPPAAPPAGDLSLKLEVQHAIERSLQWLAGQQNPAGYWSQPDHPALTGLVVTAFLNEPTGAIRANPPAGVKKGLSQMLSAVQPDGGIYVKDLANYNTSVVMTALVATFDPAYEPILRRARSFLVGLQQDYDQPRETDNPMDGGIGYGSSYTHSDLSNTMFAMEALYYTKFLARGQEGPAAELKDLNWEAALRFVSRCQNLPGMNDQPWASDDPANRGGFIYFPGDSKAGEEELEAGSGRKALRSYGSISYAGLLSLVYADLGPKDPRVRAVVEWLGKNFTLDENPGMGAQGLYYYYHAMAKALAAAGIDHLTLADGSAVDWRRQLAVKLLDLQRGDGSWVNENGRWWEKDPVLVTSYAAIALEVIHRGL